MTKVLQPPPERNFPKPLICCIGTFYALTEIAKSFVKSIPEIIKENACYIESTVNESGKSLRHLGAHAFSGADLIAETTIQFVSEFGQYGKSALRSSEKEILKEKKRTLNIGKKTINLLLLPTLESGSYIGSGEREIEKASKKILLEQAPQLASIFRKILVFSENQIGGYILSTSGEVRKTISNTNTIFNEVYHLAYEDILIPALKEEISYTYPMISEIENGSKKTVSKLVQSIYLLGNFIVVSGSQVNDYVKSTTNQGSKIVLNTNKISKEVYHYGCDGILIPLLNEEVSYLHPIASETGKASEKTVSKLDSLPLRKFFVLSRTEISDYIMPTAGEGFKIILNSNKVFKEVCHYVSHDILIPLLKEEVSYAHPIVSEIGKTSLKINKIVCDNSSQVIEIVFNNFLREICSYTGISSDEVLKYSKKLIHEAIKINGVFKIVILFSLEATSYIPISLKKVQISVIALGKNLKAFLRTEKIFKKLIKEVYSYIPSTLHEVGILAISLERNLKNTLENEVVFRDLLKENCSYVSPIACELQKGLFFTYQTINYSLDTARLNVNNVVVEVLDFLTSTAGKTVKGIKIVQKNSSELIILQYQCLTLITTEAISYLCSLKEESWKLLAKTSHNFTQVISPTSRLIIHLTKEFISYLGTMPNNVTNMYETIYQTHAREILLEEISRVITELFSYMQTSIKETAKIPDEFQSCTTNDILNPIGHNAECIMEENISFLTSAGNELIKTGVFLKEDLPNSFENHLRQPFLMWWHPKKLILIAEYNEIKAKIDQFAQEVREFTSNR